jgi:hypothetical protein
LADIIVPLVVLDKFLRVHRPPGFRRALCLSRVNVLASLGRTARRENADSRRDWLFET